ncbi:MAG: hypothetical protein HY898_00360 [Deltaproteobacteria bacterium]|nr:hypothetical protein [Deltaproteobacteria bacterium]
MQPLVACPYFHLHWFFWDRHTPSWLVLVAWLVCMVAHGYLALRSRTVHRAAAELQSLATRGEWARVVLAQRPSLGPAIAAALSLLLVPASMWLSLQIALRQPKPDSWRGDDRWRVLLALIDGSEALNLGASFCLLLGFLAAFAWASHLADVLRYHGLQRAARIALQAPQPSIGSPFRRHVRSDDSVASWVNSPGPAKRSVLAAALCLAATAVVPMSIGIHEYLCAAMDTPPCGGDMLNPVDRLTCEADMLEFGERRLALFSGFALAGGALSTLAICAACLTPALVRRRRCKAVEPGVTRLWVSAGFLGGALLLTLVTRPYAQENALPFPINPPGIWGSYPDFIGLDTGDAPDELVDATTVDVGNALIDGMNYGDPESAGMILRNKRELWKQLNPGKAFPGVIVLGCRPGTTARRLIGIADVAAAEGYTTALVPAVRGIHQSRPVLGNVWVHLGTAVRLQIDDQDAQATISVTEFPTCADVLQEGARLRRRGLTVRLKPGG